MIQELCCISFPSLLGGADQEILHQILLWQKMGIKIHICHSSQLDKNCLDMKMEDRGCIIHKSRDWKSVEGMHCISFCNSGFLEALPEIKKYARTTTTVNCMTYAFDKEIEMQKRGLIDFHLYQTKHAMQMVGKSLIDTENYRPILFKPYFHLEDFPFNENRPTDEFRFGRISRDDPAKFGKSQLWIYETMTAPRPKAGLIMGWSDKVQEKFGRHPENFIATVPCNWISAQEFYKFCDAIIMTTDTFENLPRVSFEAMSSGSVLVVDNSSGWKEQVESGKTGWLCNDSRDFIYKASRLAHEHNEREDMGYAARAKLENEWGIQTSMDSWEVIFKEWTRLKG